MGTKLLLIGAPFLLSACFYGDENDWASRDDIVQAARRCGVSNFEPTEAGSAYAAYVPREIAQAQTKEDCIYRDLKSKGLIATR